MGEMAGTGEKQKTWLLPSRNLLSSGRNKKYTHQGQTLISTDLVGGTESECERREPDSVQGGQEGESQPGGTQLDLTGQSEGDKFQVSNKP